MIDTLAEFDKFCRKNNLRYFLIGGTLLGAIRHKGFIPWDDDIDIGMPQNDYDKFKKKYINNESYYFIDCFANKNFYLPFGKFCSNRIDLHENLNTKVHIGAYIDIFPFNFIKDSNQKKLQKYMTYDTFSKKLMNLKYVSTSGKSFIKKIILCFCHIVYPFSLNQISKKKIRQSKKFISKTETVSYGNLFGAWGLKEISKFEYFKEVIDVEFEGKKYYAPSGYDSYLKGLYGDYMTLPPVEKRITHHSFTAYFKK